MAENDNKEIIKAELKELMQIGRFLLYDVAISEKRVTPEQIKKIEKIEGFKEYKNKSIAHKSTYQRWFTKVYNVVKILLPDMKAILPVRTACPMILCPILRKLMRLVMESPEIFNC